MAKKTVPPIDPREELLSFLSRKKLTVQEAIELLETVRHPEPKWKKYLKAILPKYETR